MFIRFAAITLLSVFIAACGGGGGSGTKVSVLPKSVTFQVVQGDSVPAPINLDVSYVGDGVVVGYPPNVPQPGWLNVSTVQNSPGAATFALAINSTNYDAQTLRTTLRFATGRINNQGDPTDLAYTDVPVIFQISKDSLMISAQPDQVAFQAESQGALPSSPQAITVTFTGTTSSIDPSTVPDWLSLTPTNSSTSPQQYSLIPNTTHYAAGTTLTANIVFNTTVTGHSYSQEVSVPVSYTLTQAFAANAPTMSFTGINGSAPTQPGTGYVVNIVGDHARWTATADQSWVKLSTTSGTGPGSITVVADGSSLSSGTHSSTLTISDSASGHSQVFTVTSTMHAAKLLVTPTIPSVTINSATPSSELKAVVTLTDELNSSIHSQSVQWSLASIDVPWLKWSPASGGSSPAVQATASIDPTQLSTMPAGNYTGNVALNYQSADGSTGTLTVPVTLNLQLPLVQAVSYYVATANTAGSVILRGQNFDLAGSNPVLLGATSATNVAMDSTTQATVSFGALSAGSYHVQYQNAAGINRGVAKLFVMSPQSIAYQVISAPTTRTHLIVDAERSTLYAANPADQELEIYRYTGGTLVASSPLVIVGLQDAALSPDGKSLVVVSNQGVSEVDLTQSTLQAQMMASVPYPLYIAMGNDGKYFITTNCASCSGFTQSYLYDGRSKVLGTPSTYPYNYFYEGYLAGSADGSHIYIGSNGVSPAQTVSAFTAKDDTLTATPANFNLYAASVSRNASRVILQNTEVFDINLNLLGHIPGNNGSVVSPDATRAYAFSNSSGAVLNVYDLTAALITGAKYPLLQSITLANDPGYSYSGSVQLAVSADQKTVFVSGTNSILAVPVH